MEIQEWLTAQYWSEIGAIILNWLMNRDWLTIIAIVSSPLITMYVTRSSDDRKEEKHRKLKIYKNLMSTRGYVLSYQHVEALNLIQFEFQTQDKIMKAWHAYHDSLNKKESEEYKQAEITTERAKCLVNLLYEMSKELGYKLNRDEVENSSYAPEHHLITDMARDEILLEMNELLKSVNKYISSGKQNIMPVHITNISPYPSKENDHLKDVSGSPDNT